MWLRNVHYAEYNTCDLNVHYAKYNTHDCLMNIMQNTIHVAAYVHYAEYSIIMKSTVQFESSIYPIALRKARTL